MEECNVLVTASVDGSLRIWTYEGHYIGKMHLFACAILTKHFRDTSANMAIGCNQFFLSIIAPNGWGGIILQNEALHNNIITTNEGTFGQEKRWQLGVPSTYQHPLAPSDTLLDPTSITQLEKRLERSSLKLDTPATTTATTKGDGQDVSDRHREAADLSVESVISIHESPEPVGRKRGGEKLEGEKNTTSVINLAELETRNSEVH